MDQDQIALGLHCLQEQYDLGLHCLNKSRQTTKADGIWVVCLSTEYEGILLTFLIHDLK